MSITWRVLGGPGCDNALSVQVDSGQAIERLLFDCGEGCVGEMPFAEVLAMDHLFFSHFHMDHVGGFDSFFRANFNRDTKVNRVWGPPQTIPIMQHRFRGFVWNLHEQMSATWRVSEIHPGEIRTARFELHEAFAITHDEGSQPFERMVTEGIGYTVESLTMDHRTPSLAYIVREKPRHNIDTSRLAALDLRPGPWMKQLKEVSDASATVLIEGTPHAVGDLRDQLIVETAGDSIAYLSDFLLDESAMERLIPVLACCHTVICEGQYRHADIDLALKNYHMTTVLAATLAQRAQVGKLVLFHLSDRYDRTGWSEMLRDAKQVFPNTSYPVHWGMEA